MPARPCCTALRLPDAMPSSLLATCRTLSQMKRIARAMYSNPPVHGARIVAEVVNDEGMFGEWKQEMEMMSGRIMQARPGLV